MLYLTLYYRTVMECNYVHLLKYCTVKYNFSSISVLCYFILLLLHIWRQMLHILLHYIYLITLDNFADFMLHQTRRSTF